MNYPGWAQVAADRCRITGGDFTK